MTDSNIKEWPKPEKPKNTGLSEGDNPSEEEQEALGASGSDASAVNQSRGLRGKRGIYLLPNLLTTGTLFGGFYAILAGLEGNYEAAAIAIFAAMFFDGLDGRVARMTHTQTEFGMEYDSLSDMVAFGVAPAVLVYMWILEPLGNFGWSVSFVYLSCAALRLARFNVKSSGEDKRYFVGLASPAAAALVASMVWSGSMLNANWFSALLPALFTIIAGLLMVSNIRYYSFKDVNFAYKVPFTFVAAFCLVIAIVMADPPRVLLILALCYALYAPVIYIVTRIKKLSSKSMPDE